MTLKTILPLGAACLVAMSGCATQNSAPNPVDSLSQRVDTVEGMAGQVRDQGRSSQAQIADLGRKLDTLSGDLARLRDGVERNQTSQAHLLERMGRAEQRLDQLAGEARDALQGGDELRATLSGLRADMEQRVQPVGARVEGAEQRLARMEQRIEQAGARADANETRIGTLHAEIDQRVRPVGERAEGADQRLARLEQRIGQLAAHAEASEAQTGALRATLPSLEAKFDASASRVDGLDGRLARIEKRLEEIAAMAQDALDATGLGQRRILGKVVDSITLTDDKTLFPINSPVLGERDMAKLDELAARVRALGTYYHLQIQGHTDGFGSEDYNYELGRARAEVVKNYLNEKGGIPLLRMSVISYGASEAANYSGKSNRRIVLHVLQ